MRRYCQRCWRHRRPRSPHPKPQVSFTPDPGQSTAIERLSRRQTSAACTQCWAGRIPATALGPGEAAVGDEGPEPFLLVGDEGSDPFLLIGDVGPDPFWPTGEVAALGDEGLADPVLSSPAIMQTRCSRLGARNVF